jgi:hypothetical protein
MMAPAQIEGCQGQGDQGPGEGRQDQHQPRGRAPRSPRGLSFIRLAGRSQAQAVDLALVGVDDLELEAFDVRDLVARRHVAEGVHDDAADGVELLVAELDARSTR